METEPLCLAYIRVSTDLQELSMEAQTSRLMLTSRQKSLPDPKIFADDDTSGGIDFAKRPQGQQLLAMAQAARADGRAVTLMTTKVDRFGRDRLDIEQTVRLLQGWDVELVFLDINVDTTTPMGSAFLGFAAIFAQLERSQIRERIQTVLDYKRGKGELTGTVPYGWNAVETGHLTSKGVKVRKLVDNPEEQRWILRMLQLRNEAGWGYHSIAKFLNEQNVPTKRGAGELMKLRVPAHHQAKSDDRFTKGKWNCGHIAKLIGTDQKTGQIKNRNVREWLASNPQLRKAA